VWRVGKEGKETAVRVKFQIERIGPSGRTGSLGNEAGPAENGVDG